MKSYICFFGIFPKILLIFKFRFLVRIGWWWTSRCSQCIYTYLFCDDYCTSIHSCLDPPHIGLLNFVLAQWLFQGRPDDFCKKLLKNCYDALPPNGKVVIIDPILPDNPETDIVSRNTFTSDMILLGASPGGADRTRKELEVLALLAGFDKPRVPCRAYNMWVVELHKKKW